MNSAILGKKLGMTSIFAENGKKIPVTVIEAGPCPVVMIRTNERDGYQAMQIGFGEIKEVNVTKPQLGQFAKAGVSPKRFLKEFRGYGTDISVGDEITVEFFKVGEKVRVSGNSKGRGFQGVIKRHNFGGVGMQTHGQSDRQRHPGSIGSSSYPSRVFKGMKMAGRMGGKKVTVRNLQIVGIMPEQNIMLIKGCVPGAPDSLLEIVKI